MLNPEDWFDPWNTRAHRIEETAARGSKVRRKTIMLLAIWFLSGCSSGLDPVPPIPPIYYPEKDRTGDFDETRIGVCSAGLSKGSKRAIRAEFNRRGGEIGLDFRDFIQGTIFSRTDINSSDKTRIFEIYIDCVNRYPKTEVCSDMKRSCKKEYSGIYMSCLEDARNKCIKVCVQKFGYDRNECVTELCNPNERNISHWTKRRCRSEEKDFFKCESKFRSCLLREE